MDVMQPLIANIEKDIINILILKEMGLFIADGVIIFIDLPITFSLLRHLLNPF
jgi:hypothetical protein